MFKENDSMRPGATPERVLAICRLLAGRPCTSLEIYQLSELNNDTTASEESIRYTIEAAEDLGLIEKKQDVYALCIPEKWLESAGTFRKKIVKKVFENHNSTFFKLTEWFVGNEDQVLELSSAKDYAAVASKAGVENIKDRHDILAWRFWMRYLGHAYQYSGTFIPNMKLRLEDAFEEVEKDTSMTCTQFVSWIKTHIPEAAVSCTNERLPLAISNGLRVLQNEGKVELISTKDAIRTALYPLRGVEPNDFSDIVIKGGC